MDFNSIIMSLLFSVTIIITGYFIIRLVITVKNSNNSLLFHHFTTIVLDLTIDLLEVVIKNISNYKSEEQFKNDLSNIVVDELIPVMESAGVKNINKDRLLEFVKLIYDKFEDELNITKKYNKAKENLDAKSIIEEEHNDDIPTENISESLTNIINETKIDNMILDEIMKKNKEIDPEIHINKFSNSIGKGETIEQIVNKSVTNISSNIDEFYKD